MLDPRSRRLLVDALRPPDGFAFDRAVGTTYTLDLLALLTVPLAFARFDPPEDVGGTARAANAPRDDALALLEALRRCADRTRVFCQAGRVKVPPPTRRLAVFLEDSVIEVAPPSEVEGRGGVFHPKVWIVRYGETDGGDRVRYRLLCLSRNLTFDRSWDTAFVLQGDFKDRKREFAANRPLARFFSSLPELAVRRESVAEAVRTDVDRIARDIPFIQWDEIEGAEEVSFHAIGLDGTPSWPFRRAPSSRVLVVAPFVDRGFLDKFGAQATDRSLASTSEALLDLGEDSIDAPWSRFTLADSCDRTDDEESGRDDAPDETANDDHGELSGLHAKLFVADEGWKARVWTGSANATTAAFERNVEFLIEFVGAKSKFGVEATLGSDDGAARSNLGAMLARFEPEAGSAPPSSDETECERRLDAARRKLSTLRMSATIERDPRNGEVFRTTLRSDFPIEVREGVEATCRIASLPPSSALRIAFGAPILLVFGPHAPESISSFFAFEIAASAGSARRRASFAANVPLIGAPGDRKSRLLKDMLADPEALVRFLLLLLADDPEDLLEEFRRGAADAPGSRTSESWLGAPLLEYMLAALRRRPEKLEQLGRVFAELRDASDARSEHLAAIEAVWSPIARVLAETRDRSGGGR
jgi:hypothetical protein